MGLWQADEIIRALAQPLSAFEEKRDEFTQAMGEAMNIGSESYNLM